MNIAKLISDISQVLDGESLTGLEGLSEDWLEFEYQYDRLESRELHDLRRSIVMKMIIDKKLKYYEEEY